MSVTAAPPGRQPPAPPPPLGAQLGVPEVELPEDVPRGGLVKRAILGCLVVLLAAMGTSAVFVSGEIQTLRKDLSVNPSLQVAPNSLASASFGGPQTLLLVGDDQRLLTKYYHRAVPHLANEMLLVRLDPSKPWISMMSIPRELWVTIHPPGRQPYTNRLNSAYTFGISTLVSTIRRVTGLSVNHVVVITFGRFKRAIDQMGCVYSTVDRRYYHVNLPGTDQYQEINLYPGYQDMCGDASEQFVSYRHGDTSLVRDARDQSFLLDVKKQYGPTLAGDVHRFEQIFGQAVQTDPILHTTTGILDLLGTLISSSGRRVRQVHFQANLLASYDTASPQQIAASVHSFLFGGSSIPKASIAAVAHEVRNRKAATSTQPLIPTPQADIARVAAIDHSNPFTVEYPRVEDRAGSGTPVDLRNYTIPSSDGTRWPIYVEVFSAGQLGQFYDVQGTTWLGAPMFARPDQSLHVGNRTYDLYYEGQNLKMIAWREHNAIYWVRNSLTDAIGNGEMLAIAEQTESVNTAGASRRLSLGGAAVPNRTSTTVQTGITETIGSIGGLLTLILVPMLAIPLIRRQRAVGELRTQLRTNLTVESRLTAFAQAVGAPRYVRPIAAPTSAAPTYSTYRARTRPRRSLAVIAALLAVAAVATAAVLVVSGGSSSSGSASRAAAHAASNGAPTIPVKVLNAGGVQGAASRMAAQLRSQGVHIAGIGDVTESRAAGLWVLYAPGQQIEAAKLADLLASRIPRIAPIDPTAQAAAGGAQLVLVIQ